MAFIQSHFLDRILFILSVVINNAIHLQECAILIQNLWCYIISTFSDNIIPHYFLVPSTHSVKMVTSVGFLEWIRTHVPLPKPPEIFTFSWFFSSTQKSLGRFDISIEQLIISLFCRKYHCQLYHLEFNVPFTQSDRNAIGIRRYSNDTVYASYMLTRRNIELNWTEGSQIARRYGFCAIGCIEKYTEKTNDTEELEFKADTPKTQQFTTANAKRQIEWRRQKALIRRCEPVEMHMVLYWKWTSAVRTERIRCSPA